MSANSATGSAGQLVQKLIIENDVANQLRSRELKERLEDEDLTHASIELYLR